MKEKIILVKDIEVSELQGEKIMIDFETGKYFLLKGTANDIWDLISNKNIVNIQDIIQTILDRYEVSEEECTSSTIEFLNILNEKGFIEYRD